MAEIKDRNTNSPSVILYLDEFGNVSDCFPVVNSEKDEQLVRCALQRLVRPNLFDRIMRSFWRSGQ
jgi:hypothetical protein